jgi:hypothetical protein
MSPWTPSYSVTVQGNVTQTNEGLDDLEQLPTSAAQSVTADGFEEQPVTFTEALISGEATSSTIVVADQHVALSATLDEPEVSDSVVQAEAQDIASEQNVIAQAEPSVSTPPEPVSVEEVPEEEIEQGSFIVDDESTVGHCSFMLRLATLSVFNSIWMLLTLTESVAVLLGRRPTQ